MYLALSVLPQTLTASPAPEALREHGAQQQQHVCMLLGAHVTPCSPHHTIRTGSAAPPVVAVALFHSLAASHRTSPPRCSSRSPPLTVPSTVHVSAATGSVSGLGDGRCVVHASSLSSHGAAARGGGRDARAVQQPGEGVEGSRRRGRGRGRVGRRARARRRRQGRRRRPVVFVRAPVRGARQGEARAALHRAPLRHHAGVLA